jgi:hypothetical protein
MESIPVATETVPQGSSIERKQRVLCAVTNAGALAYRQIHTNGATYPKTYRVRPMGRTGDT